MVFSSPVFLFVFLPSVTALYYILPRKFRNFFLLIANLIFYGWGEPVFILVMAASILCSYYFARLIRRFPKKSRLLLAISVSICLGFLVFFKYTGFFAGLFLPGENPISLALPIGISFYTFQIVSYLIDVYRNETLPSESLIDYGAYVSLFPQLIAGPIVRYSDIAQQLKSRNESAALFAGGIKTFLAGLSKKVLIANPMGLLWSNLQNTSMGAVGSLIGILAFTFQIYFDFSGYSDMARGLGKMFGFDFAENFNYPYISKSITDFWRRWHISLSGWFRDYVYIPLGGSRKGKARTVINLFIVWSLTGFWHGASFNFIVWGIYYFVLLVFEKFVLSKIPLNAPPFLSRIYTMAFVMFGWTIFYFEDFSKLGGFLKGFSAPMSGECLYYIIAYIPLLIIAALSCLPVWKRLYEKLDGKRFAFGVQLSLCIAALLLCTASIVKGSYNPFLYFRF